MEGLGQSRFRPDHPYHSHPPNWVKVTNEEPSQAWLYLRVLGRLDSTRPLEIRKLAFEVYRPPRDSSDSRKTENSTLLRHVKEAASLGTASLEPAMHKVEGIELPNGQLREACPVDGLATIARFKLVRLLDETLAMILLRNDAGDFFLGLTDTESIRELSEIWVAGVLSRLSREAQDGKLVPHVNALESLKEIEPLRDTLDKAVVGLERAVAARGIDLVADLMDQTREDVATFDW